MLKSLRVVMLAGALVMFAVSPILGQSQVKKIPQRSEIAEKYKWRLQDIYPSDEKWEQDFSKVEALLPEINRFRGHLAESGKTLLDCLVMQDSIWVMFDPMYVYAYMKLDEDTRVAKYQEMSDRAAGMNSKIIEAFSFIDPEILSISQDRLKQLMGEEKGLALYAHYIDNIQRNREHTLSTQEEKLLAQAGPLARVPRNVFTMIDDADVRFGSIIDEEGNEVQLTRQRYAKFLESTDRRVRKDAMDTYSEAYVGYINALGANLAGSIKKDIFFAQARNYNSTLEASLHADNIPVAVFDNLIETVNGNLKSIHQYVSLRKKYLGLDELHKYDMWVPLVPEAKMEIPYDSAVTLVLNAVKPMGKKYVDELRDGFNSGWVDVYETEGKGSGAYSWGAYTTHPYMLLNYNNSLDNLFTVAHEMGHNMHRLYSSRTQPYIYSGHSLFVAEVASTTNEMLLMDYLLKNAETKEEKLYLLNYYIEMIQGTFYTQVMFAEFERDAHARAEAGEALSAKSLRKLYRDIYQKYEGPDLVLDSLDDLGCLRISHFYRNFYVYKYATSLAAASAISQKILAGDKNALKMYTEGLLKAGDSEYPIDILKNAGVDMTQPEPVNAMVELYGNLVNEFEQLLLQ
jgi:oligoendopeptidase F